jgi:hypothetical protein
LALAVSLASWVNILALGWRLSKPLPAWFVWRRSHSLMLLLSLLLGGLGHLAAGLGWLALLFIPVLAAGYLLAASRLGVKEATMIAGSLRTVGQRLAGSRGRRGDQ